MNILDALFVLVYKYFTLFKRNNVYILCLHVKRIRINPTELILYGHRYFKNQTKRSFKK